MTTLNKRKKIFFLINIYIIIDLLRIIEEVPLTDVHYVNWELGQFTLNQRILHDAFIEIHIYTVQQTIKLFKCSQLNHFTTYAVVFLEVFIPIV